MAGFSFRLDRAGIGRVLKSPGVRRVVNDAANEIADNARAEISDPDVPVVVDEYTTDRDAASVTIAHPTGLGLQARHGTLTKAAGRAGAEVRER